MSDVQEGYKMCEVGVIPEEWEVKTLGDCLLKKPEYGINAAAVPYSDNLPVYIRITDISDDGKFLPAGKTSVNNIDSNNFLLEKDDIVFARTGASTGKTYLYSSNDGELVFAGFLIRVKVNPNKLIASYLKSYTETGTYWNWVKIMSMRSGQPGINGNEYAQLQIPLPPLLEQKAIASALSDVDALIAALEQLITKKRNIKQGAMQQLITGKKRLSGFSGGWVVKAIGKEIDLLTGFPFPSSQYSSCGIKLLRGSNIKRGVTDWSGDITAFWEEITPDLKNYTLNEGDIVIAMDSSLVGRSFAILSKKDLPALLLQRVARIRSNKIDVGYLKEFICSDYFSKYCDSVKTVTAIPHISPDDIRNFTILLPPSKEEQQAIAKILSDMDTEVESLEQKRDKYKAIKQGMMQELLTGKRRLLA